MFPFSSYIDAIYIKKAIKIGLAAMVNHSAWTPSWATCLKISFDG